MELTSWEGLDKLHLVVKGCKNGGMLFGPLYGCFVYVDIKWLMELIPWIKIERIMLFNII